MLAAALVGSRRRVLPAAAAVAPAAGGAPLAATPRATLVSRRWGHGIKAPGVPWTVYHPHILEPERKVQIKGQLEGPARYVPKNFRHQQYVESIRTGEYLGPDWPYNFLPKTFWSQRRYNVSYNPIPPDMSPATGVLFVPRLNIWTVEWHEQEKQRIRWFRCQYGFMKGKQHAESFRRALVQASPFLGTVRVAGGMAALRVALCSLLAAARGAQLLDDAVGLVQSSQQWHSWNSRASIDKESVIDDLLPRRQVQWHSFDSVGPVGHDTDMAVTADKGTALIDESPVAAAPAAPALEERRGLPGRPGPRPRPWAPLAPLGAAASPRGPSRKPWPGPPEGASCRGQGQGPGPREVQDDRGCRQRDPGPVGAEVAQGGVRQLGGLEGPQEGRRGQKQLEALGSVFNEKDADEAAAAVESLAWPAHERLPKPAIITMLNRARLGNRLFQWSALLAIAKEAGARVAAPANGRYTPTSTPQIANLEELIWSGEEMDWLNEQPNKCHMWDRDSPLTLDLGMEKLQNWTLANVPKGETHVKAAVQPKRGENWARLWADAILDAPTTETGSCDVVELDGFWQRAEFFVHHLDWLRPTFWNSWNAETAGVAKETLDGWLSETGVVGAVVGVHLRLGDYPVACGRNLNMDYYRDGLLEVKRHRNVDELTCVIFSDDINLAREVAEELEPCTKRIPVYPCAELKQGTHCWASQRIVTDKVSFYMMSLMPNIIIADSTYSFWAAVLAPNKPMVVTPRVVEPARIARRGDYSYLDSELYGWWGVNASLGNHTSKAVQKALEHMSCPGHPTAHSLLPPSPSSCFLFHSIVRRRVVDRPRRAPTHLRARPT
ncbi:unnamed protein product [Prorocentrum cordatum]|uniref:Uncharacterized protein n=1 Tax=Prorocentrum cordatum TaxID=2364126 RepID=A0ABN9XLP2_9DINO|nr:unnamed protein product [Polarella glacialis]